MIKKTKEYNSAKEFYERLKTDSRQIKLIQEKLGVKIPGLIESGFKVDGIFGYETFEILLKYQKDNNLYSDGKAGKNTLIDLGLLKKINKLSDFYKEYVYFKNNSQTVFEKIVKELELTHDQILQLIDNNYRIIGKVQTDFLIDRTGLFQVNDILYNLENKILLDELGNVLAFDVDKGDLLNILLQLKNHEPNSKALVENKLLLNESEVLELKKNGFKITGKMKKGGYLIDIPGMFNFNDLIYYPEEKKSRLIKENGKILQLNGNLFNTLINFKKVEKVEKKSKN